MSTALRSLTSIEGLSRTCFERSRVALAMLGMAVLLCACGGGGGSGNPQPPPQPGRLQFQATSLDVDEGAGAVTVTITRTAGSDGAVSVAVASSDGSATAAQDYTAVSTTVNFAAGDATAKTVTVTIANDTAFEADETLTLQLSAPGSGASLGANATATLTIHDNDPPSAPALTVGSTIKQLAFNWASVPGATHYHLLQKPDSVSGFTRVLSNLTATSATLDVAVHRHDWANAQYQLEACNAHGCSASTAISAVDALLQAIGYFKASNTDAGDEFGFSVALSADGNTLAVGAFLEDSAVGAGGGPTNNAAQDSGAVYVFTRSSTAQQWSPAAYLKELTPTAFNRFGSSVALSADGDTLAVGVPESNSHTGKVVVFLRDASGSWEQSSAVVRASNADAGDEFGLSVALSGDGHTLAVGAPGESSDATGVGGDQTNNGATSAGAVYVFGRLGSSFGQLAYVKASDTGARDFFGDSVTLNADGATLAVGAFGEDGQFENEGAVYVFTPTPQWTQQKLLKASVPQENALFGGSLSVSADGNTLAVGAIGDANRPPPILGTAYVFTRTSGEWSQHAALQPSNPVLGDDFGFSVALSADGNTLAVGAPDDGGSATGVGGQTNNDAEFAGAVYVFTRTGAQWSQPTYVKASNTETFDTFGRSVSLSADGNTLAVGAAGEKSTAMGVGGDQTNNDAGDAGAVYLY